MYVQILVKIYLTCRYIEFNQMTTQEKLKRKKELRNY